VKAVSSEEDFEDIMKIVAEKLDAKKEKDEDLEIFE
jgi:hypothetical protein